MPCRRAYREKKRTFWYFDEGRSGSSNWGERAQLAIKRELVRLWTEVATKARLRVAAPFLHDANHGAAILLFAWLLIVCLGCLYKRKKRASKKTVVH